MVATPIGNLEDVTLRALKVLRSAALILCEDTRTTRKLLLRHGIEARLVSCHQHNEARRAREAARLLLEGRDVALVTDAGTPVVSDPGRRVIEAAIAAGAPVHPVPGASATMAALVASGLPAERFTFFGFPPRRGRERDRFLREVLAGEGAALLFEAPHRVAHTVAELARIEPGRRASISRELTKVHEQTVRGSLADLAARLAEAPARGEYTLVLEGKSSALPDRAVLYGHAVARARELIEAGHSPRDAARIAAAEGKVGRRDVYQALLGRAGDEEE